MLLRYLFRKKFYKSEKFVLLAEKKFTLSKLVLSPHLSSRVKFKFTLLEAGVRFSDKLYVFTRQPEDENQNKNQKQRTKRVVCLLRPSRVYSLCMPVPNTIKH